MRQRKYDYYWVVQGKYPGVHGWEDLCQSESYREARTDLKAYRENEPQYPHRMIHRRELREQPNPEQIAAHFRDSFTTTPQPIS